MLTKENAADFTLDMSERGTGGIRDAYRKKYAAGSIAKRLWNRDEFTLGIEYGILIAFAVFYEDLQEEE